MLNYYVINENYFLKLINSIIKLNRQLFEKLNISSLFLGNNINGI